MITRDYYAATSIINVQRKENLKKQKKSQLRGRYTYQPLSESRERQKAEIIFNNILITSHLPQKIKKENKPKSLEKINYISQTTEQISQSVESKANLQAKAKNSMQEFFEKTYKKTIDSIFQEDEAKGIFILPEEDLYSSEESEEGIEPPDIN